MIATRESFAVANGRPRLPYDAEVQYLETTGTQYFDTGLDSYKSSTPSDLKLIRYEGRLAPMGVPTDRYLHGGNNWGFWGIDKNQRWVMYTSYKSSFVVERLQHLQHVRCDRKLKHIWTRTRVHRQLRRRSYRKLCGQVEDRSDAGRVDGRRAQLHPGTQGRRRLSL